MSQPRRIDLVVDRQCPNLDAARSLLRAAIAEAGLSMAWREWEREAANTPNELQGLGSPTILVDGVDVSRAEPGGTGTNRANHCRLYVGDDGVLRGVPPLRAIVDALSDRKS